MQDRKLTVIHSTGSNDIEVPPDISIGDLINELTVVLPLLRPADGHPIKYRLDSKSLGRTLSEEETVASSKIPDNDSLILTAAVLAGGPGNERKSRISVIGSSVGLPLDDLSAVEIKSLLANEPALMMTLHSFRTSLNQLDDSQREVKKAKEEIDQLQDRLKDKNIATVLLILGQIQLGFGINLITNQSTGGWFVFLAGLAVNLGALIFSFSAIRRVSKTR